jgi:hypothetical protein
MSRPFHRLARLALLLGVPCLILVPAFGLQPASPVELARRGAPDGTWSYEVRKDDVLGTIAQRELGTMRRVGEILELNPGLEPRALAVGSALRMPPRQVRPAEEPSPLPPAGNMLWLFLGIFLVVGLVVTTVRRLEARAGNDR